MIEIVYADPPWHFRNEKTGGSHKSGAGQKYPTMQLDEIQRLPVPAVTSHSSVLALWVPCSMKFSHGATVLDAWGYRYVTTVYWNKLRLGMGFWFRGQVEELLIGVRGDYPAFRCQLPNIISLQSTGHSEKPEAFRQLLEKATGTASSRRNLEMFARKTVPGWRGIGNQVTGNDIRTDLRLLAMEAHGQRDLLAVTP